MSKPEPFNKTAELEALTLLFEKVAQRLTPNRYCEVKIVIQDGRIVDAWVMDKAKSIAQIAEL